MLKQGITLMHEHVKIDLSSLKNEDSNYNDFDEIVKEFKQLYEYGVRNIVDVTNIGMGRDIDYVQKVSELTNINIISCTGYYQDKFFPKEVEKLEVEELANILIEEINVGIEGSSKKAQVIGEIGTSKNLMTSKEKKAFLAAIKAHKKTNAKISTHCTLGTHALEQIELFKENKVDLKNVVIGHLDLTGDIDYILQVLEQGAYIEFDTIGKNNYMPDDVRVKCLKKLVDTKYASKIFLSMDITRKSNLKNNGGIGYTYLFETFIPLCLENGITQEFINKMLIDNPRKFLEV